MAHSIHLIEYAVLGGIASSYVVAPFDESKAKLESEGYRVISLEENARLRIQEGAKALVSRHGNWVREGFLYVPGKGKVLTKASPIMESPVEATQAHRILNDFYITDEQVEKGLADSIKFEDSFLIPTERFGEDKFTVYFFGNSAKAYGEFLKGAGIKEMAVAMVDRIGNKSFVRQAWFDRSVLASGTGGGYWNLSYDYGMRGVRNTLAPEPKTWNVMD